MVELTHDWVIAIINIDDGVVVDNDDADGDGDGDDDEVWFGRKQPLEVWFSNILFDEKLKIFSENSPYILELLAGGQFDLHRNHLEL